MTRKKGAPRPSPIPLRRAILRLFFAVLFLPAMAAQETPGDPFPLEQRTPLTNAQKETAPAFPNFNLEVSLLFGLIAGQSEEIVYKNSEEKLSQLLWDLKPLAYTGGALYFEASEGSQKIKFFSDFEAKFGFPMKTGVMEDRDWLDSDTQTHYSIHDSYAENAEALDFETGLAFPLSLGSFKPTLKSMLGFSYMRYFWSGRDGHGEYASGRMDFSGTVITYDQRWFIPNAGVGLQAPFLGRFSAELSFRISPLVWCVSEDHHKTTSNKYLDIMSSLNRGPPWGIYLEPQGSISFSPNSRIAISLYCSYRHISGIQGVSYSRSTKPNNSGVYSPVDNPSGAGYSAFDAGIRASLRF